MVKKFSHKKKGERTQRKKSKKKKRAIKRRKRNMKERKRKREKQKKQGRIHGQYQTWTGGQGRKIRVFALTNSIITDGRTDGQS